MLDLKTLFFRVNQKQWYKQEYPGYFFSFPETAYTSIQDALDNLPPGEITVSWEQMALRVYDDIRQDA